MNDAMFRRIVETTPDAVIAADDRGKITFWNDGAYRIFGYSSEEMLGKSLTRIMPAHYRPAHRAGFERLRRTGQSRVLGQTLELQGLRRNGAEFPIELSLSRWHSDEGSFFTAIIRDVGDRKRVEQDLAKTNSQLLLLQTIATVANKSASMRDAIQETITTICRHMNWQVAHVYMVDRGAQPRLYPTTVWFVSDPELFSEFQEKTERISFKSETGLPGRVLASGQPAWITDLASDSNFPRKESALACGLKSGFAFPVFARESPAAVLEFYSTSTITDKSELLDIAANIGSQLGHVVEREKNQDRLEQMNIRLEESNRRLEEFASIASHDLQEPLRKISAFGDRLNRSLGDQLDERSRDYLARVQNAALRMKNLISDLLALARLETKTRDFTPVHLGKILQEVLADLETRIEETRASIVVENSLPVIMGVPTQIRQLFQNLFSNSLKFHREGVPPVIHVRGIVLPKVDMTRQSYAMAPQYLQLIVSDNGIGFDEKYTDKIFTMFERLHGRGRYEGTGMGLPTCKRIVELHRGHIEVKSKPGAGSDFIITLPLENIDETGA